MQYLGSKSRIAKPLAAYLESVRKDRPYLEPFMGAGHVLMQMTGRRYGSDACEDLILMWQAVRDGWVPPAVISEQEYQQLRQATPSALRAYAGFQCSFGGKWFAGYARNKRGDNYASQGIRSVLRAAPRLSGVAINHHNYKDWLGLKGWLIYCDPPYEATTSYRATSDFSHPEFWQWCREMDKDNLVLVSSYQAPEDFQVVWSVSTTTEMRTVTGRSPRTEKLFQRGGDGPTRREGLSAVSVSLGSQDGESGEVPSLSESEVEGAAQGTETS